MRAYGRSGLRWGSLGVMSKQLPGSGRAPGTASLVSEPGWLPEATGPLIRRDRDGKIAVFVVLLLHVFRFADPALTLPGFMMRRCPCSSSKCIVFGCCIRPDRNAFSLSFLGTTIRYPCPGERTEDQQARDGAEKQRRRRTFKGIRRIVLRRETHHISQDQ